MSRKLFTWIGLAAAVPLMAWAQSPSLVLKDGGIEFPDGTLQDSAAGGPPAPVPQTGQTSCWDSSGTEIICSGTGQDGDLRFGQKWPDARFTNNGDGTVTDELTGLTWLQDANCFGQQNWIESFSEISELNAGVEKSCASYTAGTFSDWRLANVKELQSLTNFGRGGPSLPEGHPFSNAQSDDYWSSTSRADAYDPSKAWQVNFNSGWVQAVSKDGETAYVWPVRGGR